MQAPKLLRNTKYNSCNKNITMNDIGNSYNFKWKFADFAMWVRLCGPTWRASLDATV